MGARASVMLKDGGSLSPVLCQHYGGEEFHEEVKEWIREHYEKSGKAGTSITDRWEMCRIFVRLVQRFGDEGYVETDRSKVDDSQYGCLVIDVTDAPTFSVEE
jgi:hypothetical protein